MKTHLQIHLADNEGVVLRILGLIQRRGFSLLTMRLHPDDAPAGGHRLDLIVNAGIIGAGQRSPGVLRRQLLNLIDVLEVRLQSPAPNGAEPPHACVGALGEFGIRHRRQMMPQVVSTGGFHEHH